MGKINHNFEILKYDTIMTSSISYQALNLITGLFPVPFFFKGKRVILTTSYDWRMILLVELIKSIAPIVKRYNRSLVMISSWFDSAWEHHRPLHIKGSIANYYKSS